MLGTNYNFDYICSDKRGLLPLMIVPCTDIIGSNDIFAIMTHLFAFCIDIMGTNDNFVLRCTGIMWTKEIFV